RGSCAGTPPTSSWAYSAPAQSRRDVYSSPAAPYTSTRETAARDEEGGTMAATLSQGFQQLLREPSYCELATVMPDGSPQIVQVWVDTDGEHILINTPRDSQKVRNIRRDPRVAVNVFDPGNQWRLGNVRGKVIDVTTE